MCLIDYLAHSNSGIIALNSIYSPICWLKYLSSALTICHDIQNEVDLFASKPAISSASPTVDLFASNPVQQSEIKSTNIGTTITNIVDPFATVPLNNFDESDLFGSFTSHSDSSASQPSQISVDGNQKNLAGNVSADLKAPAKKDSFQVKSGIWADSLSRGLIDLNISSCKYGYISNIPS